MKHLIILVSVVAVGMCMPGGWSEQNATDPSYLKILNDLQNSGAITAMDGSAKLIKVESQVVSGMNYKFTFDIGGTTCYIKYYEQAWTNTHQVLEDTCRNQKRQLAGGYTTQDASDPQYTQKLNMLATKGLITLPSNGNMQLVGVKTQVVAGMNYEFTLMVNGQKCMIEYYEVPWEQKHEITSDTCSMLSHKRQLAGGWSPVTDTTSPAIQSCLSQSLDRINSMSNSMYRLVDSQIVSIEQQVVRGIKYKITMMVGESTCMNSGDSMGLTSAKCPSNANSVMTPKTWEGQCVYVAWENNKTTLLSVNMNTVDVDLTKGNSKNDKLLGGDGHDQVSHGKGLLGGDTHDLIQHGKDLLGSDGHDLVEHGKKLLGGDGHDLKQHGKELLGGDTHDLVDHVKNLLGGDDHDLIQHGKKLLGGDTHDLVDHVKNLLGGDGHDLIKHGKELLGGDDHDLVDHVKNLLGGDGHDLIKHGKELLGGDDHDLVQHGKKLLGGDTHDLVQHVSRHLIGQDGHDNQSHGTKTDKVDCTLDMYNNFKKNHNKLYRSEEEDGKRYKIFCDNMRRAKKFQEIEQGTARYGPTKFADLTKSEFQQYVGKKWDITALKGMKRADIPKGPMPESFDWREHGAVTEVKNQGSCGSCWAFSTTGNIEGQWAIKKKQLISLSEQELVDCDKVDEGCNGGLPTNAYKEIERLGGLDSEKEYPYRGEDEKCVFKKRDVEVYINDSVSISSNETEMAAWLAANGPISIGINAFAMQFYMGGISHPWSIFCSPSDLDHGVLIVGYGVQGSKPYWIVKNSWGPDWGEKGYYLVYRGAGVCGLNRMCTSSVVYN